MPYECCAWKDLCEDVEKAEDVTPALLAWDEEIYQSGAPAALRRLT